MAARDRRRALRGRRDLSREPDLVPALEPEIYDKVFAEALFHEPELLSSLGLVEQFGITGHDARLSDESPAHERASGALPLEILEDQVNAYIQRKKA